MDEDREPTGDNGGLVSGRAILLRVVLFVAAFWLLFAFGACGLEHS